MGYGTPGDEGVDVLSPSGLEWLTGVRFDKQLSDRLDRAFDGASLQCRDDDDGFNLLLAEEYVKALGFDNNRIVGNLIIRIFDHVGYPCSGLHVFIILKKIAEDVSAGMCFDLESIRDIDLNAPDES